MRLERSTGPSNYLAFGRWYREPGRTTAVGAGTFLCVTPYEFASKSVLSTHLVVGNYGSVALTAEPYDRGLLRDPEMPHAASRDPLYRRRRYSPQLIEQCVRWYLTYRLSYRDLTAMMPKREVTQANTTIMRWVRHDVPEYERLALGARNMLIDKECVAVGVGDLKESGTLGRLVRFGRHRQTARLQDTLQLAHVLEVRQSLFVLRPPRVESQDVPAKKALDQTK